MFILVVEKECNYVQWRKKPKKKKGLLVGCFRQACFQEAWTFVVESPILMDTGKAVSTVAGESAFFGRYRCFDKTLQRLQFSTLRTINPILRFFYNFSDSVINLNFMHFLRHSLYVSVALATARAAQIRISQTKHGLSVMIAININIAARTIIAATSMT